MASDMKTGWAIHLPSNLPSSPAYPNRTYIGVGWFNDPTRDLWSRYAGHNIMIWDTRREAREALKLRVKPFYPSLRVRVERVAVVIQPYRHAN